MGAIYFELAPWSSMRLCLQLEETFPDLKGWRVELVKQLCFVAYNYEIYDGVGVEGWLRTTVSLPQQQSECNSCIFSEESAECDVMRRIAEHCSTNTACETYWSKLQELHRELAARVKIHSNIIPREAYREKLNEELRRRQHGSSPPRTFRREFYPIGVLADAVKKSTSTSEKTNEWRRDGGQCVLTRHLHTQNVPQAAPRDRLRAVKKGEVSTIMTNLGGAVQEVSWRNGIYARKMFYKANTQKFETERDVALRVSHPHVIRPIRQTLDVNDNPCLLMEVLGSNLHRLLIRSDFERGENSLVEDPVESLDVLLQIARGLKSLHDAHVVHGDIKPQNILYSHFEISEDVRHFLVKIADFDEAQVVSSPEDFKPSHGTTRYAAPEVLKWTRLKVKDNPRFCDPEKPDVDSLPYKLDIYGFGCVAYEVLTGQDVYGNNDICGENLMRVAEGILTPDCSNEQRKCTEWKNVKNIYPRDLMRCLESCWALNPSVRPSSSELCEVLKKSKSEMQHRVAWKERRKYLLWNFLVPSLIAFFCCFAASCIGAEKFWNWLENLAVVIAAVALVGFVCIYCHNYPGKLTPKGF